MRSSIRKKAKIRQHFVPRFYLRNFGNTIYCFDKKEERKFLSNPKNMAVKNDFYGGEYAGLPSLETAFSQIEQMHSQAIKKLIETKDYYKLNHHDKTSICEFFALQFLRTESKKNDSRFIFEKLLNLVSKNNLPEYLEVKLTDESAIHHHLDIISDYKKFARLFFNMKFIIWENHTPVTFWTSDNPITKQNEYAEHPLGNLGIISRGIEIHLPLSPTLSIWAVDPTILGSTFNTHKIYHKQHIIRENFLQLKFASRFVYSNSQRFHLITSMLKDNPHFKDESLAKTEIFTGESDEYTVFMSSEMNSRGLANNKKRIMGKLDTWMDPRLADELFNIDKDN